MSETVGSYHRKNSPPPSYKWLGGIHKLFMIYPFIWQPKQLVAPKEKEQFIIYNSDGSVSLFQEIKSFTEVGELKIVRATDKQTSRTCADLCMTNNIHLNSIIGVN